MDSITNDYSVKNTIDSYLQNELSLKIDQMVIALSEHFKIPKTEIVEVLEKFEKKLYESQDLTVVINIDRCMGRTKGGLQCTRSRKSSETEFCGSHLNNIKYGRIDGEHSKIETKGRGRPKKTDP